MKTWSASQGYFDEKDLDLLELARAIFLRLPTIENEEPVSCHHLAEAFARHFSLKRLTGHFAKVYQHSWLVTENGNVLDVYPVGIEGGPILVESKAGWQSPGRQLYKATDSNIPLERVFLHSDFEATVEALVKAMQEMSVARPC